MVKDKYDKKLKSSLEDREKQLNKMFEQRLEQAQLQFDEKAKQASDKHNLDLKSNNELLESVQNKLNERIRNIHKLEDQVKQSQNEVLIQRNSFERYKTELQAEKVSLILSHSI